MRLLTVAMLLVLAAAPAMAQEPGLEISTFKPTRPPAEAAQFEADNGVYRRIAALDNAAKVEAMKPDLEAIVAHAPKSFRLIEANNGEVVIRASGDFRELIEPVAMLAAASQPPGGKKLALAREMNVYGDAALVLAQIADDKGDRAAALKWLDAGLAFQPDSAAMVMRRASVLAAMDRKPDALLTYDRWLKENPLLAETWKSAAGEIHRGRGALLFDLKQPAAAAFAYRSALEVNPHDRAAKIQLAYLARAQGRADSEFDVLAPPARTPAEKARYEQDAKVMAAMKLRNIDAIQRYRGQLQAIVQNAPARYWMVDARDGALVIRAPVTQEQAHALAESIGGESLAPGHHNISVDAEENVYGNAALLLGSFSVEHEDYAEAVKWLDAGVRFQPDNPMLVTERALALGKLKRSEEALAGLDAWVAENPALLDFNTANTARVHRGRGGALLDLDRVDEAEAAFNRSLEYEPKNSTALNELTYIKQLREGRPKSDSRIILPGAEPAPEQRAPEPDRPRPVAPRA